MMDQKKKLPSVVTDTLPHVHTHTYKHTHAHRVVSGVVATAPVTRTVRIDPKGSYLGFHMIFLDETPVYIWQVVFFQYPFPPTYVCTLPCVVVRERVRVCVCGLGIQCYKPTHYHPYSSFSIYWKWTSSQKQKKTTSCLQCFYFSSHYSCPQKEKTTPVVCSIFWHTAAEVREMRVANLTRSRSLVLKVKKCSTAWKSFSNELILETIRWHAKEVFFTLRTLF